MGDLWARVKKVPSLTLWVFCFMAYTAARMQGPLTRDMLTYSWFIIREVMRHGGQE